MKLANKVAVVVGGASGIRKAFAERFGKEKARIVIADRDGPASEALARQLSRDAFGVPVDVTCQESIDNLVATVVAQAGGIDILVNCAASSRVYRRGRRNSGRVQR
jgi:D-sorbitol dehydrogenase (acceptor)